MPYFYHLGSDAGCLTVTRRHPETIRDIRETFKVTAAGADIKCTLIMEFFQCTAGTEADAAQCMLLPEDDIGEAVNAYSVQTFLTVASLLHAVSFSLSLCHSVCLSFSISLCCLFRCPLFFSMSFSLSLCQPCEGVLQK